MELPVVSVCNGAKLICRILAIEFIERKRERELERKRERE